jgi:hypothetical protein
VTELRAIIRIKILFSQDYLGVKKEEWISDLITHDRKTAERGIFHDPDVK